MWDVIIIIRNIMVQQTKSLLKITDQQRVKTITTSKISNPLLVNFKNSKNLNVLCSDVCWMYHMCDIVIDGLIWHLIRPVLSELSKNGVIARNQSPNDKININVIEGKLVLLHSLSKLLCTWFYPGSVPIDNIAIPGLPVLSIRCIH